MVASASGIGPDTRSGSMEMAAVQPVKPGSAALPAGESQPATSRTTRFIIVNENATLRTTRILIVNENVSTRITP